MVAFTQHKFALRITSIIIFPALLLLSSCGGSNELSEGSSAANVELTATTNADAVDDSTAHEFDNERFRYSDYPCIGSQIYVENYSPDILFLGNSRSKRAVNSIQMADAFGGGHRVVDLSKNYRGNELNFQILEDYLKVQTPKVVFLEFTRGRRGDEFYHPNTIKTLRNANLRNLVFGDLGDKSEDERQADYDDIMSEREKLFTEFMSADDKKRSFNTRRFDLSLTDCTPKREKYNRERLKAAAEKMDADWFTQTDSWDLDKEDIGARIAEVYMKKMIALADERDIPVILYHVGRLGQSPLSEDFKQQVEARFGKPYIALSGSALQEIHDVDGFRDPTHMSLPGSEVYSKYFVDELKRKKVELGLSD